MENLDGKQRVSMANILFRYCGRFKPQLPEVALYGKRVFSPSPLLLYFRGVNWNASVEMQASVQITGVHPIEVDFTLLVKLKGVANSAEMGVTNSKQFI